MSDFGEGYLAPEQLAEHIKLQTFGHTIEELKTFFDRGKRLRWGYDKVENKLTVGNEESFNHKTIDPTSHRQGTTGYVSRDNSISFFGRDHLFSKEEKEAIKIVLFKFFKIS